MANQVAARLAGDEYQHLTSWLHVLDLKRPRRNVREVTIEDENAGSADDVTVRHETGSSRPDTFYQIKFHVDQRGTYSSAVLTESKGNGSSLLQKLFATWKMLASESSHVAIRFVSNWSWDPEDKAGATFSGRDNTIKDEFFDAGPKSDLGKVRLSWEQHLRASSEDFTKFCKSLHFDLGATCFDERVERVSDQMENLGLRCDEAGLKIAVGIVREWIRKGTQRIDLQTLDEAIERHGLKKAPDAERCVTVVMTTIKAQRIDVEPDYLLDWRDHFAGPEFEKGHALKPGEHWEKDLLPQLRAVEGAVSADTGCRLVRARGLARLSAWFAFGRTFSENARYVIECDQQGDLWRSNAIPSSDFQLIRSEATGSQGSRELFVGISITTDIEPAVREYAEQLGFEGSMVLLAPSFPLGRDCLRSANDAVALARQAKDLIRNEIRSNAIQSVSLFYAGPLSGACFIGHVLNSMGAPIQVMEYQEPGYAPAFTI